jgi:undecaprenyl-diphosphatase
MGRIEKNQSMNKSYKHNGKVVAFRPSPEPLLARPPFLARHPWVGFLIFFVCATAYTVLTQQVLTNGPLIQQDQPLAVAIYQWAKQQPAPVIFYMRFFSAYGRDGVALIVLVLAIGWIRRKARRELWMLFFGVLGAELWFQLLGGLVQRPRPSFKDPFETLIGAGYPSGHAATNVLLGWMAVYLLWPHIRSSARRFWLVFVVVYVVASVLFSRMFLGLHYLTDIIGGMLIGFGWGALVFTITDLHFFRYQKEPGFAPEAVPVTGKEETSPKR